jgi:putative tryptophan/tyrosine transport system substrate-binding protein
MRRRPVLGLLLSLLLAGRAAAQQRLRRVAVVTLGSLAKHPVASFAEAMRELGYQDGLNVELLPPWPDAQYAQLAGMAEDAVKRQADVIVTYGATATQAARKATRTVPIVMVIGADPIELGIVSNLARPEGNITGIGTSTQVLIQKRVELLKQLLPGMQRLAALWNSSSAGQSASLQVLQQASQQLGVSVYPIDLKERRGLEGVAAALQKDRPDALTALPSTTLVALGHRIVKLAAELRIAAVYTDAEFVRAGGLISYSADAKAQLRRAAHYVDRILKGAQPRDLAIEQPTKFDLAVNLRTAKSLGLSVPAAVMIRADEVIQ